MSILMKIIELTKLFSLEGKVAAITGGGGVLCSEIGRCLGRLGVKVAVLDIVLDAAARISQEIQAAGGEAEAFQCDVLSKPGVEAAAQAIRERFGRIDILIN